MEQQAGALDQVHRRPPTASSTTASPPSNKLGSDRVIVPVQIIGDQDGAWDKAAWKTEAFYGNPLTGFTAAP